MYGDLTDKETICRIDEVLESHYNDQFEILLYKKNSECLLGRVFIIVYLVEVTGTNRRYTYFKKKKIHDKLIINNYYNVARQYVVSPRPRPL